jgi:molybdate transport system substrate-binding protein
MFRRLARLLVAPTVALCTVTGLWAQRPPTIAAAANLNFALTEIANQFKAERGTPVDVVFGASATLTRQIQDGAPFELFLAADEEFPNQLTKAGLTRDAGVVYATGQLVLFAPNGSPLTVDERLNGLARLIKSGRAGRFAIANPDVAPYGKAAESVLRKRGLWEAIRPQLVLGDTIAQAAQFATTGNAIGGLVAYSLVLGPGFAERGKYAVIPESDHPPLRQRMVLLKRAGSTATQFYTYIQGKTAEAILRKHGYGVPQ